MKTRPPLLDLENITMLRGGRPVLNGLSFRIGVGENVAILGPNGSGKSSLLKLLTRELYPVSRDTTFRLRILGKDRWELFDLRRHLGIVSMDLQAEFARECSGWEAVVSGFFSSVGLWDTHRVTPEMERKAWRVLARLEVEHLANRLMTEMSSGEARRILLGRALIHDPEALVLDEPTTSLDLRLVRELRQTMRMLARSGTALILVTHAIEEVIPEIRRVILLREGRVFKDGPKEKVLTAGNLSDLYRMKVRLEEGDGCYHVR
ncbi:MAG TPA: ATP-binding cassette domain-containing protein [Planctomycetota bacterium]|nr:ATP-binding cassette domain-containing protein [Planctomycetota bacterium]